MCILQPNAYVADPELSHIPNFNHQRRGDASDYTKYYNYIRELINEDEKYGKLKEHFIDMSNVFDGIPNVYIDAVHVSPNGNEIVVDNLLKHLKLDS